MTQYPWNIETLAVDEATIRYKRILNAEDKKYFLRVMNLNNPFSEPAAALFEILLNYI